MCIKLNKKKKKRSENVCHVVKKSKQLLQLPESNYIILKKQFKQRTVPLQQAAVGVIAWRTRKSLKKKVVFFIPFLKESKNIGNVQIIVISGC